MQSFISREAIQEKGYSPCIAFSETFAIIKLWNVLSIQI